MKKVIIFQNTDEPCFDFVVLGRLDVVLGVGLGGGKLVKFLLFLIHVVHGAGLKGHRVDG